MTTESDNRALRRQSQNIFRTPDGIEVKRAAERGLLPFLDDPEALKAELHRRIAERIRERYPDLTPADTPECEPPPEAGPARLN